MFVQVIEGRARDAQALRGQLDRWMNEQRPQAKGFLGTTGGVTNDGDAIFIARFESPDAAKANSDRPEQGQWWADTERCFEGEVRFVDSDDVETFLAGGSNDAGFVQVMKGSGVDRARLRALDEKFEQVAGRFRPDLIGGLRAWTGPDSYVEFAYFTSEAEARRGEAAEVPPELLDLMSEYQQLMSNMRFQDITDPWLY